MAVCLLFTLLPLLSIRRVSPLRAIRSGFGEAAGARDPLRWVLYGLLGAAVLGFALWQTDRWQQGVAFAVALAVSLGLLVGVARLVAWITRRWTPRRLPFVWRQGLANLHRPHNRTVLLLLSLGLGTFLMLTLVLTRSTLLAKITGIGGGKG